MPLTKALINKFLYAWITLCICFIAVCTKAADESFSATMVLFDTFISIQEEQNLRFANTAFGVDAAVVTNPSDNHAAVFSANGQPNAAVTASVKENNITLTTGTGQGPTQKIRVDQFLLGGDVDVNGNGNLDSGGFLNNIRIGATAAVQANDIAGVYLGLATFRLVYQ